MTRRFDRKALPRLRRKAKITQVKLAECSGIPLDTIRDYEQGRSTPSVERLFLIADTLGVRLDDFAADTDTETGNACSQTNTARS